MNIHFNACLRCVLGHFYLFRVAPTTKDRIKILNMAQTH